MRAVFRLVLRRTEGLIGSVIALPGLALMLPDHSTMCRRGQTLELPPLSRSATGSPHLLVDSTGLKLGGAGEWLVDKHGTSRRRSWRRLHIGIDAESGELIAIELTGKDVDDAERTGGLIGQITDPIASFTADGAYDQEGYMMPSAASRSRCRDPVPRAPAPTQSNSSRRAGPRA